MKTNGTFRGISTCLLLAGMILLASSTDGLAQDSVSPKTGKKGIVVLKMKKDVNGNVTVIDTSFSISSPSGQEALEKYLEDHEAELESVAEKLRDIDFELSITDSADIDSLTAMAYSLSKDNCIKHFRWHRGPGSFNYDFEFPRQEEFDFEFPGDEECLRYCFPEREVRIMKHGGRGGTLADMIGDIPMERVKSYSVKDKKGGKRIVIELEDGPSFINEDRVIIINKQHGKSKKESPGGKQKKVKVIVEPDENN